MINEEWKWVPVEPTKDMIEAAFKKTTIGYGWIPVHYRAMLAAAPTLLITDENTSQERVRSEAENKYEPVAWRYWNEKSRSWNSTNSAVVAQVMGESGRVVEPLYLHPPPTHMPEPMTEAEVFAAGIEAVAAMIEAKARAFADQHGSNDMGSLSFGRGGHADMKADHYASLCELADEVRSMTPAAPTPPVQGTVTVRYDLSTAETEAAIRDKLIELGWTPPGQQQARKGAYSDIVSDGGMDPRNKPVQQDDEALEALRLALDALVWESGSEPGLYAAQTLKAVESIRAIIAKRGAA